MRCSADVDLGPQEDPTHRPRENDLVDRLIPALHSTAGRGAYHFHRNAFFPGIRDMLAFRNATDQEPPLRMEEPGIEGWIVPTGAQAQPIHVLLGDGQVIVVAGPIDQSKDPIGDADRIENQKETTGPEQDPFQVRVARQTLAPARELEEPRYIFRSETTDDELGVERRFDPLLGPPERGVLVGLGHGEGMAH